jgi:PAS domain S-box-containing protein
MPPMDPLAGNAHDTKLSWDDDAWFRGLVESATDSILTVNVEGIIEHANMAASRMLGFRRDELLGRNVTMIMPEVYARHHDEYLRHYLRTGEQRIIGIGREVVVKRKDGDTIPVHLTISAISIEGRQYFSGVLRDISLEHEARREQERLLGELKERNKKITCLYSVGEVIREQAVETDIFREIAYLIRPACSYPERTRVRIVFDGHVYEELAISTTPWSFSAPIVVGGRTRGKLELVYREAIDPLIPGLLTQGDCDMIEAIARTMGEAVERREAEAKVIQASKLASIGELAAGVGHEINNPINGVINCADILLENIGPNSPDRRFAELIRSEAERVASIVKKLLTFSRQQQEKYSMASVADILDAVLSLSNKKIEKSLIELRLDVPTSLPRIRCRGEQLQQVFMNLIINSIHALDERYPEGSPNKVMRIAVHPTRHEGRAFLEAVVEDFGVGMTEATLTRLFDPFFTTKGRDKGTGLGLSVSDGIVKDHGGFIDVESEPGSYARFRVFLPVDGPENERSAASRAREHEG